MRPTAVLLLCAAAVPRAAARVVDGALKGHRLIVLPNAPGLEANLSALGVRNSWVASSGHFEAEVPPAAFPAVDALLRGQRGYAVAVADLHAQVLREEELRGKHPYAPGMRDDDFYLAWRTPEEIYAYLREVVAAHAGRRGLHVSETTLGTTHEGRPIIAFVIEGGRRRADTPAVLMHGGQHSGEWIGIMTNTYFVERLVAGYGRARRVTRMVDSFRWVVAPVLNVDGFAWSWSAEGARNWRKTRTVWPENAEAIAACELATPGQCAGCVGTDPNRNWDNNWAGPGTAPGNPCSGNYPGPRASSEVEPLAAARFVANDPYVVAYLDHHCCGDMWMSPWGWTAAHPESYANQTAMGRHAAAAIAAVHGRQYAVGSIEEVIYPASGNSVDYQYGANAVPFPVATEMRRGDEDQILPNCEENWAGIQAMADWVSRPEHMPPLPRPAK